MKKLALIAALLLSLSVSAARAEGEMVLLDGVDDEGGVPESLEEYDRVGELTADDFTYEEEVLLNDDIDEVSLDETATLAPTATPEPTPVPTELETDPDALVIGAAGEAVQRVQTDLTRLGYYTGKVSGSYGENTAEAVRAFQADHGLRVTGAANTVTRQLLESVRYRPLRFGSSGEDVKRLQVRLADLGYYGGKISGNYLESTQTAVTAFQKKMGERQTGEASAELQTLLFGDTARMDVDTALKTSAAAAEQPEAAVNVEPQPTVKYTKRLQKGDSGTKVKQLQQQLTDLGYYNGPVSGNFQAKTHSAVVEFQKQNGLAQDGVVGQETWDALFNDPYVVLPGDPSKSTPAPSASPYHVVVDVNNQVVTVYCRDENGDYTVRVRDMICSSGTVRNPSPIGDWVLNERRTKWCFFPTWGDYARYWKQITPSVAFHSVLYNSVDTMDLRTNSYKNLGRRASHGCVRLLVSDAKWVYDHVGKGTVVTITDDLPDDPELRASVKQPALNTRNMLPVSTPKPTQEPVYVSGAQPPQPLRQLGYESSGEDVFWLQKKLAELGFYKGKCTGTYLGGTQSAVREFQRAAGLSATGTADVKTLQKLYERELNPPTPTPALTPPPTATPETGDIPVPNAAVTAAPGGLIRLGGQ